MTEQPGPCERKKCDPAITTTSGSGVSHFTVQLHKPTRVPVLTVSVPFGELLCCICSDAGYFMYPTILPPFIHHALTKVIPAATQVSHAPNQSPILTLALYITAHPNPYIALSTSLLTTNQSALRSANSYTSSARKMPLKRSPSAITAAISFACFGPIR